MKVMNAFHHKEGEENGSNQLDDDAGYIQRDKG
jgi:hypothetical protein